ncbi:unnamed protein product [marine sediment metagenome]|uniref:Uncharacterized protein n=1 Tax=marine sediment metagenome TaxID=412755 RepID=X1PF05_9ZZZZ
MVKMYNKKIKNKAVDKQKREVEISGVVVPNKYIPDVKHLSPKKHIFFRGFLDSLFNIL